MSDSLLVQKPNMFKIVYKNYYPTGSSTSVILPITVGSKYKFGNATSELTATSRKITVAVPVNGYIKMVSGIV